MITELIGWVTQEVILVEVRQEMLAEVVIFIMLEVEVEEMAEAEV